MATEQQQKQPANFAAGPAGATTTTAGDLSAEIAATIDREPGDRVRVTHISGDNYRCNWWAPGSSTKFDNPLMYGLTVTTHVVRQSRFLTVVKTGDGLVIRDHPHSRAGAAPDR